MGFTGLALGAMLGRDGIARANEAGAWSPPDGLPHLAPKAKSVIWLFMLGGTSHLESFDPKPALNRYAGKMISDTPFRDVLTDPALKNGRDFGAKRPLNSLIYPLQVGYRKRGQSGIEVSDWFENVGSLVDDITFVRSVWLTDKDHAAEYEFNTGHHIFDGSHPAIGAWVKYGLGSLNDDLPEFVALGSPPGSCCGGAGAQSGSYLGPVHSAVPLKVDPVNPLQFASPGGDVYREEQSGELEFVARLNKIAAVQYPRDPAMRARIKSYELAARMQTSVPDVVRLGDETEATHKLYGLNNDATRPFGQLCLTARRLVERGVRFVQVYHGDGGNAVWDSHNRLRENHSKLCGQVDQPIAALLKDLKQRGLLEETIVVWGSEFGRTPISDPFNPGGTGRDHHPYGFTVWMAGGGLKGGVVHGATDELGFHAIENRHYITDIHATVLHQLGLDSRRLEVPGHKRLEIDFGKPIHEIMA